MKIVAEPEIGFISKRTRLIGNYGKNSILKMSVISKLMGGLRIFTVDQTKNGVRAQNTPHLSIIYFGRKKYRLVSV